MDSDDDEVRAGETYAAPTPPIWAIGVLVDPMDIVGGVGGALGGCRGCFVAVWSGPKCHIFGPHERHVCVKCGGVV